MLYAKYGRIGVELLQSVFRDMGLRQDDASVQMVKETIAVLSPDHPVQSYLKIEGEDLQYPMPAWWIRFCTVASVVTPSMTVLILSPRPDSCFRDGSLRRRITRTICLAPPNEFYPAVNALPEDKLWSVMERVQTLNACHFFMACRPERPKESYTIDFSTEDSLDYVPLMRMRCGLSGTEIFRPDWSMSLNAAQLPFVQHIDGRRTIREIAERVAQSGDAAR